jgi:hypothetical protein
MKKKWEKKEGMEKEIGIRVEVNKKWNSNKVG